MLGDLPDFQNKLIRWYRLSRRDLPWRVGLGSSSRTLPDPYHVLVSEIMLQQTQVATVIPYFKRFVEHLPNLSTLAVAPEQELLRLWQGLGYYRRARNLQRCAAAIIQNHDGQVPCNVESLIDLPGIGRYTAGAIASLAFNHPAPILDGNVTRVLCRLDLIQDDPRDKTTSNHLWQRAAEILPRRRPADFNSALMELGATLCTPKSPQCPNCPVRNHCAASQTGLASHIPQTRKATPLKLSRRCVLCIRSGEHFIIEQRPSTGRWAGLWQFKTLDLQGRAPTPPLIKQHLGLNISKPVPLTRIRHALSHRRYEFDVYTSDLKGPRPDASTWATLDQLDAYPLPRPHLTIVNMLRVGRI